MKNNNKFPNTRFISSCHRASIMHSMNHTIIPFSFASFYLKTKKQREIKSKIIRLDEKWGICTVCNRACKPRLG